MYISDKRSKRGKRIYPPDWWVTLIDYIPRVSLSFLEPKEWTKEKALWWVSKIPAKCPFERQLWIENTLVLYIPPLCPLNPLSTQLFGLRLKAQTYLSYLSEQD